MGLKTQNRKKNDRAERKKLTLTTYNYNCCITYYIYIATELILVHMYIICKFQFQIQS